MWATQGTVSLANSAASRHCCCCRLLLLPSLLLLQVLELGSGCGQLGLILVRNLPHAAEVCLTEQAFGGALEHLQTNVIANRGLPNMGSVSCCACDWTHVMLPSVMQAAAAAAAAARGSDAVEQQQDAPHSAGGISQQELLDLHKLLTTRWDVVVGSDLIYNEAGARALPRVLATLMRHAGDTTKQQQQPVCYYAHTKHRCAQWSAPSRVHLQLAAPPT